MKTFILNIGLLHSTELSDGTTLNTVQQVKDCVRDNGLDIISHTLAQSDSEPTLILHVTAGRITQGLNDMLELDSGSIEGILVELHDISDDLKQDCIAVYDPDTQQGLLVGELSSKWGTFNPEYFLID